MNKLKKKKKLKLKLILVLIVVILFIVLGISIYNIYNSLTSKVATEVQVLESIENYNYNLEENETEYYKSLFKDLKEELEKEEIDEEIYVSLITQLFISDFYSLSNSINKNDVGGVQFIYTEYQDDFIKLAKDTIYKYVENNIYGKRTQTLPTVSEVKVTNIETDDYESENGVIDENAYYVDVDITYLEDLGYQEVCSLIIIHANNKLEIASVE
ncbi:MAG: hypothetical protein ACK5HP_00420 [Bacilli bacterium]